MMFVALGLIGAVLLVTTFIFDDWLDELIPGLDVLSGPVVGASLAAFGLFGWFAESEYDIGSGPAIGIGIAGGTVIGYGTYRAWKALQNQPTDATPTAASAEGKTGRIVTPVVPNGIGEALIEVAGRSVKFTVTADEDLAVGERVVVVEALSPTRLRVQSERKFWD